ncbi:MAG: RecX family transcriptional regulator [Parachlamydia sp.]|nr:MAG: RecX family transcriptional regulator [Parachlamydia sp.]
MKISCIQGSKRGHLLIHINEEPWKEIHSSVWGNRPALPQDCSSLQSFVEHFYELEYPAAKQFTLRKLAVRSYFVQELQSALQKVFISEPTSIKILAEMTRLGFLDDQAHSERWIRSQAAKKWGPYAIVQKLRAKGVVIEDFSQILAEEYGAEERKKQIRALLNKKLAARGESLYPERQKAISSLMRKGFDLQEIQDVLKTEFYD